jgi:microsomal dipeptidase-like Zn-dependent dipeptidase
MAERSEAKNATAELVRRGYSKADIARLSSGTLLRILAMGRRPDGAQP